MLPAIPSAINVSLGTAKKQAAKIKAFSTLLVKVSRRQMIHASETDLHQSIQAYLPDSTISEGYDIHLHEIGQIDTFRLVFHEYFDLYDNWSKTYLNIFSPSGQILQSKRLWELSFEGSTDIHFIDNKIIEIVYHDFFKEAQLTNHALIPDQLFYLQASSKTKNVVQGRVYEYYKIGQNGTLERLSQKNQVREGRDFPQSSVKLLSKEELKQFSLQEIQVMKDEIIAEYSQNTKDITLLLSDVERLNLEQLDELRREY